MNFQCKQKGATAQFSFHFVELLTRYFRCGSWTRGTESETCQSFAETDNGTTNELCRSRRSYATAVFTTLYCTCCTVCHIAIINHNTDTYQYMRQHKAPQYMTDCCFYTPHIARRQHLWSASCHQLLVPRHRRSMFGCRAFSVAAQNSLPDYLRDLTHSADSFHLDLKTLLFSFY